MSEFGIPRNGFIGWECAVCKTCITGKLDKNTGIVEPESGYWNLERMEVYCSAGCGLKRHESIQQESEDIMKGQIVDVHAEGEPTFRACVLEVLGGDEELARVVNLDTGETSVRGFYECGEAVIENIFNVEG